ncbi:hypothetical protein EV361DRAFT_138243 [Lentinula raphanica]|uniref:Copper-fist domain-containing protein n=1 Tax=Lentinula raphanica TaxID=153919 RepID=A0AA38PI16_9AGAR|nr:hypothetical protein F5880DRAFT_242958 [Lentinula raphanica]KAJ3843322.1 hypothetical protein F5878DRAFT_297419 [Lentinula raphanica]KAJ3972444.1 hypothetical protein EV361DRAFT_138243 [Lentinula raphanica]
MVLFNDKKYACETCIKGHRSSGCKHTDRALYEIKKKGRPVTQCEQCRELRKTKQVHVKCICPKRDGSERASSGNLKGLSKTLQKPAFPNGLPQVSLATQHLSETSSDSEFGSLSSCRHAGGNCRCSLSRRASRGSNKRDPSSSSALAESFTLFPSRSSDSLGSLDSQSSSRGRLPEFRNVMSKPYGHEVSSGSMSRHNLHQHENSLYSPYGRAYDYAHPNHPDLYLAQPSQSSVLNQDFPPNQSERRYSNPRLSFDNASSSLQTNERFGFPVKVEDWDTFQLPPSDVSVNGSDDPCTCPTCVPQMSHSQMNCTQPECRACYDSSVYSSSQMDAHPPPPPNNLSIYNNNENGVIDAWIKQVYVFPTNKTSSSRLPYAEPRQVVYNANGDLRIRTPDDLPPNFDDTEIVDIKPSLNPDLLRYSPEYSYRSSLQYDSVPPPADSLDSRLEMGSLSAELAGVNMNRSRAGSMSASDSTSESEVSDKSGLKRDVAPTSLYYQPTGTSGSANDGGYSSYPSSSSPSSLPDQLCYF